MYTIDVTKHELSRAITDQQRTLNDSNTHRHRQNRADFIMETTKHRGRNSTEHKVYINKNLANIQKQQIQLKKLGAANDLIKSRIQDEENLLKNTEKFPYGKENVDISQDVLERYKGNYQEQSRILQKFRMEAELMKKTSRVKGSKGKPFDWCYRQGVTDNRKKQKQLKIMRQTLQKQLQQQRALRQREKRAMKNITQSLANLSIQLHNNSYTIQKGIRQLQQDMKKNQRAPPTFPPKPHFKDILDLQTSSQKIPVIVYKNQPHDARLYFSDVYRHTKKVHKDDKDNLNREEYKEIVKILKENNRRLVFLDKLGKYQAE